MDALSLSTKKASEQDVEIRICARTLMQEFGFPNETLGDFDKLVRLAIQSVRRNKKRSEKRSEINNLKQKIKQELDLDALASDVDEMSPAANKRFKTESSTDGMQFTSLEDDNDATDSGANHKVEDPASRLAFSSLVQPFIPSDNDRLPSLKHIHTDPKFHKSANKILQSIKRSRTCFELSNNNRKPMNNDLIEELGSSCLHTAVLLTLEKWFDHLLPDSLSYIKMRLKSNHTLATIVKKLDSTSLEVNGLNDYLASSLFKRLIGACVKDFGMDTPLNPLCDIFHNTILKDFPILTKDVNGKNSNKKSSSYFSTDKPIIDSIIPSSFDFPLSTSELPIPPPPPPPQFAPQGFPPSATTTTSTTTTSPTLETLTLKHAHVNNTQFEPKQSLPNLPSLLSKQSTNTNVKIKFQQKELIFNYNPASNAPPTLMELISNCKNAFNIINSSRVLHLRDFKTKNVFSSDYELEKILRMNSMWGNPNDEIVLELIFTNVVQDYLNLNYEQGAKSPSPALDLTPVISKAPVLPPNVQAHIERELATANKNKFLMATPVPVLKTETSSLITSVTEAPNNTSPTIKIKQEEDLTDRYLPLPRPQGPNTQKRIMMNFQPLL